jgi:tetratricopeptide (TPR) repeat protein
MFKTKRAGHYAVILAANAIFFWSVAFGFAYDDYLQILNNPQIAKATLSFNSFFALFTQPSPGGLYRPITLVSYWINHVLFGDLPWLLHAQNVCLHLICCFLVYELALSATSKARVALAAALLFSVHPIHVEAVANIIGRAELLSTMCCLATLLLLRKSDFSASDRFPLLWGQVGFFALAILSKESAYSLLFVMPFFIQPRYGQESLVLRAKEWGRRLLPFFGLATITLLVRFAVLGERFFVHIPRTNQIFWENPLVYFSGFDRYVSALKILGDYIRLLVFPINMSADYSRMPGQLLPEVYSLNGLVSIASIFAFLLLVVALRKSSAFSFAAWVPLTFSLTSNIGPLAPTIMGERLAYFPSVGFLILAAILLDRLPNRARLFFLTVLLLGYSGRTLIRLPVWSDQEHLMFQTMQDQPQSPKAIYNYAVFLLDDKGATEQAKPLFERVLRLNPNHVLTLMCLADIEMTGKRFEGMAKIYKRILEIDPTQEKIRMELLRYEQFAKTHPAGGPTQSP